MWFRLNSLFSNVRKFNQKFEIGLFKKIKKVKNKKLKQIWKNTYGRRRFQKSKFRRITRWLFHVSSPNSCFGGFHLLHGILCRRSSKLIINSNSLGRRCSKQFVPNVPRCKCYDIYWFWIPHDLYSSSGTVCSCLHMDR